MRSLTKSALVSLLAGALLSSAVAAQPPGLSRADALVALRDVWSTVKYLDPQVMERDVDWDGALVRAIPRVREAQDHDALAREIGSMLAELGDPLTRVSRRDVRPEAGATVKLLEWQDDVLVVNIGPFADSVTAGDAAMQKAIALARDPSSLPPRGSVRAGTKSSRARSPT